MQRPRLLPAVVAFTVLAHAEARLAWADDPQPLHEAVAEKRVQCTAVTIGDSPRDGILLRMRRTGRARIRLVVRPGTVLAPPIRDAQHLVTGGTVSERPATGPDRPVEEIVLADDAEHAFLLDAYGIDAALAAPTAGASLVVTTVEPTAALLCEKARKEGVAPVRLQAAIWALRDGVTPAHLGQRWAIPEEDALAGVSMCATISARRDAKADELRRRWRSPEGHLNDFLALMAVDPRDPEDHWVAAERLRATGTANGAAAEAGARDREMARREYAIVSTLAAGTETVRRAGEQAAALGPRAVQNPVPPAVREAAQEAFRRGRAFYLFRDGVEQLAGGAIRYPIRFLKSPDAQSFAVRMYASVEYRDESGQPAAMGFMMVYEPCPDPDGTLELTFFGQSRSSRLEGEGVLRVNVLPVGREVPEGGPLPVLADDLLIPIKL